MPTLDDLLDRIATSTAKDWNVIPGGPQFLDSPAIWTSGDESAWGMHFDSHYARAAYKPDVSLGIAWGLPYRTDHNGANEHLDGFNFAFPDERVTGDWLDIFWNGMPVHRELTISVDGGRATLPCPDNFWVPTGPAAGELVGYTATARSVALARLLDSVERANSEFDSYLERSRIVVIDEP